MFAKNNGRENQKSIIVEELNEGFGFPGPVRRKYLPAEAFLELRELYSESLQGQVHTTVHHQDN